MVRLLKENPADIEMRLTPVGGMTINAHYHWLKASIERDPVIPDGTSALNAPHHQAGILALYRPSQRYFSNIELGLSARYVGRRQASLDNDELDLRLDDYVRLDLFARWRLNRHVAAQLRFENLTGTDYIRGSDGDALHLEPGAPFACYAELRLNY